MEFSAQQIAALLGGTIEGNENATVSNLSKIEEGKPGTLSFLANPLYNLHIYETDATIVIVNKAFVLDKPVKSSCTLIRVEDAYSSFAKLLEIYNQAKFNKTGIEQPSFISKTATVGNDCYIGAFAYIGENVIIGNNVKIYPHVYIGDNSKIGDNTTFFSGVKIYHDSVIGKHCTVHSGTIIGSDGFGFVANSDDNKKVPQIGNVVIEDNVEIGANTCIDRATLGSTILRKGVKLDNLIQIAHNVEVGENCMLAGGVFVAGSTKLGKNILIGGQAGVVGHLKIANGVKIAAQSGIGSSIEKENEILQGSPAFNAGEFKRSYVLFRSLSKLNDRLRELEKKLKNP